MKLIFLDKASQLETVSTVVSIAVIFLLALTFGILFYLYYRYYGKCISHEVEDEYIKKEVILENKKYFKETDAIVNDTKLTKQEKKEKVVPLARYIVEKRKSKNGIKIIANTFLVIFYLFFVSMMAFAIHVRNSGDLFSVFDTSCLIIQSGSMEEKNERNTYLTEHSLDNQITTYSLIAIEKVEQEEIKLYDIVAFKNPKGQVIVHRVVNIFEENGETFYMTRGDANNGSASYELKIAYHQILGKYNGYQNFVLGIIIYYFQSSIGLITLTFGLCLIGFYDILDILLGKKINLRKEVIYQWTYEEILRRIDQQPDLAYIPAPPVEVVEEPAPPVETEEVKEEEEKVVEPVEEKVEEVIEKTPETVEEVETAKEETNVEVDVEEESVENADDDEPMEDAAAEEELLEAKKVVYTRHTFLEKLVKADESLRKKYEELKREFMTYQMKAKLTNDCENFRFQKQTYGKITISGKAIKLYLALEPEEYSESTMPVKDAGHKYKYQDVPLMIKVKSDLSMKRAKALIAQMMEKANITQHNIGVRSWYKEMEDVFFNDQEMWEELPKPKKKLFVSKLLQAEPELQKMYVDLKEELLSYKLKSRISAQGDTFRNHGDVLCKIAISGRTMKMYFALDPEEYEDTSIPLKDSGDKKKYSAVPLMIRVRSSLSFKRALYLIEQLMKKNNLEKKRCKKVDQIDIVRREFIDLL